jgi:hypothetical protein
VIGVLGIGCAEDSVNDADIFFLLHARHLSLFGCHLCDFRGKGRLSLLLIYHLFTDDPFFFILVARLCPTSTRLAPGVIVVFRTPCRDNHHRLARR